MNEGPRLRIAHVVPYLGDEASGPAYSVPSLAEATAKLGHDVTVHTFGARSESFHAARLVQYGPGKTWFGFSPAMRNGLFLAAGSVDLFHNHSLWMMPNVYPGFVAAIRRVPLVVSPRGVFGKLALERSPRKKMLMWHTVQKWTLHYARCIHATSEGEAEDVRRFGLKKPIAVIPNGVDAAEDPAYVRKEVNRELLFFGRIHPIKGIDRLLSAWAALSKEFPDWTLRIAGPDDVGEGKKLRAQVEREDLKRVAFSGPSFGNEKSAMYRASALHVLPSHSENFGMTVAEALAQGVPTIASTNTPWSVLSKEQLGDWCSNEVGPLTESLRTWMRKSPSEREAAGERARVYVRNHLAWEGIAQKMTEVYAWTLGRGPLPDFITLK